MALFSNKQEANLRSCVQMVEDVITTLGHVPDESRIDSDPAMPAWRVRKGSAWVTITITTGGDDDNHLQVSARVLVPDASQDRAALHKRLLELNATDIKGAAFALSGGEVVLLAERSTVDIDPSEVHETIARVEEYADKWDDLLVGEFGGSRGGDLV